MPGRAFNRLPASGPMAQQAEQEFKSEMDAAGQEFAIEMKALGQQYLTDEQYNNKAAILHGKHSVKALKMKRGWNQRMTMIQQYEKLGAAGTVTLEQSSRAQFALSGYDVPKREQPNYWTEHRNLVQQRERIQAEMLDPWDRRKGKGPWRLVTGSYPTSSKKSGQPSNWGREATSRELQQIEVAQNMIGQLDQYEFALLTQMSPQHRKINQLSRAMAMGPRTQQTPGVGGRRTRIPLGKAEPKARERERFETPGYKMTREKAITQAQTQLGGSANRERVIALAKQIYEGSK